MNDKDKEAFEEWYSIDGYESDYLVSSFGKIKSIKHNDKILKAGVSISGYEIVSLHIGGKRQTKYVHRLVAEHFIKKPIGYNVVNHIDGNKRNNNVNNLEWTNHLGNLKHAFDIGLRKMPTHCKKGHEFNEENTLWLANNTRRNCKKCVYANREKIKKSIFKKRVVSKNELFDEIKNKQKEIDELEKEKDYLCKKMENMREIYKNSEKLQDENAKLIEQDQIISQEIKTYIHIADRLKAENAKLRLVVDHYAQADDVGAYARIILKELEQK